MRRRGLGVTGLTRDQAATESFRDVGRELASEQLASLTDQLAIFRSRLHDFASKHRKQIKEDPLLRSHFQRMCAQIGVDPLACTYFTLFHVLFYAICVCV